MCAPMDAIVTFRKSGIDALAMDDVVLTAKGWTCIQRNELMHQVCYRSPSRGTCVIGAEVAGAAATRTSLKADLTLLSTASSVVVTS